MPERVRNRALVMAICSALTVGAAFAQQPTVTETYDINPAPVPCDGLALNGVRYAFTIAGAPSLDCQAGLPYGPPPLNNVQVPSIQGESAGVLHLTFDVPTTTFGFGVAMSLFAPSDPPAEVIVNLNRPGAGLLRQSIILEPTPDPTFLGGRFEYEGPAVKTVTISFRAIGASVSPLFAIDNTTYFRPPGKLK